ncbi:MAG: hypothetical protein KY476_17350 [Planctomycetes bacterium]|nr:hypothetical protein [Planctomycetota bacterium]
MPIQILDLPEPEDLTAEEAAAVFGGRGARGGRGGVDPRVVYEVVLRKIKGKNRFIQKKITKNNMLRLTRLKKGKYIVKYRAMIRSKKRTVSKSDFSPASSFNFG